MSRARLILQADDFGLCEEVNEGVAQAFRAGTISQASVMAPCPAFEGAAALARELGIPVGVHGTLNCEWDHLRWGPITEGASLVEEDGTQHPTVEAAVNTLDATEAAAELLAQHARLAHVGPTPVYLDCHMGPSSRDGYAAACRETGLPFLYPMLDDALRFDSIEMLSDKPARKKKRWLKNHLKGLAPGSTNLVVSHPAVDSPALRGITREDNENYVWAVANRTTDLALLLDPDVPKWLAKYDVELITAADV